MSHAGQVLLINPAITQRSRARFPLSIMTMAAALEPDYESTLIDGNLDRNAIATAAAAAASGKFAAAGITVMGGPQVATAIEMSRALRAARPDLPIVWGGYFPTLYPDVALNSDYVDYVVRGQGEESLRDTKAERVAECRAELPDGEGDVDLDDEAAQRWLTVLTDLRLAIGTRLDVSEDDDPAIDPSDPDAQLRAIYQWLTALQDSLVHAVMGH